MNHKIVPREIAHKLTPAQIVGRRVVGIPGRAPHLANTVFGTVVSVHAALPNGGVDVKWDSGLECAEWWEPYSGGRHDIDLLDEEPQNFTLTPPPQPRSYETRMFFGEPDASPHPFLRMRDERLKKGSESCQ